ncbi:hypothetical protein GUITHDRAFT_146791 [Guillardia theta CCMP2712]|uniref:Uncharacterized protein n=2 Tax=Guillardia theta TaxID=55529 RepID=L1IGI4_GUITC|nr:hypothetical protein GUITHDRAFT_146791 [Guillardia theta CCMP2712]EKX35039.1 hypothetical protein GUITHDRAFT_146791 [Guillardia theta CCMP2712]|eukprot:XP_005822019.1 hypothetical protein GUITHDRAFT_146791 [Guillardia theta CCMP2712]
MSTQRLHRAAEDAIRRSSAVRRVLHERGSPMVGRAQSSLASLGRGFEDKISSYREVARAIIEEDNELIRRVNKDGDSTFCGTLDTSLVHFQEALDEQGKKLAKYKHAVKLLINQRWDRVDKSNAFASWRHSVLVPEQVKKVASLLSRRSRMNLKRRALAIWSFHAARSKSMSLAVMRREERGRASLLGRAFASWRYREPNDGQRRQIDKVKIELEIVALYADLQRVKDEMDQLVKEEMKGAEGLQIRRRADGVRAASPEEGGEEEDDVKKQEHITEEVVDRKYDELKTEQVPVKKDKEHVHVNKAVQTIEHFRVEKEQHTSEQAQEQEKGQTTEQVQEKQEELIADVVVPELVYVDKIQQLQEDLDNLNVELQKALQGKKTLEEELKTCRQYLNRKSEELGDLLRENRDDLEKAGAAVAAAELAAQSMSRLRSERVAFDELVYWKRECERLKNEISTLSWERRISWWMKESKSSDGREEEMKTVCYRLIKMLTTKELQIQLLFQRHDRVLKQASDAFELLNERFVLEYNNHQVYHTPREREYIIAECKEIVKDFHVRFGNLLLHNENNKYRILEVLAGNGDESVEYDALSRDLPLATACRDFFKSPHLRTSMDLVRRELQSVTAEVSEIIMNSRETLVKAQIYQEASPNKPPSLAFGGPPLPPSREAENLNLSRDVTQVKRQESLSDSRLQVDNMLDSMMADMADHDEQVSRPAEGGEGGVEAFDRGASVSGKAVPEADLQQRIFSIQRAFSLVPAIQEILKDIAEEAGGLLAAAELLTRGGAAGRAIESQSAVGPLLPGVISSALEDLEEVLQLQKLRILAIMEEDNVDIDFLLGELIHVQKECLRMEGIIEDCRIEWTNRRWVEKAGTAGPLLGEAKLRSKVARGVEVLTGELESVKKDVGRIMDRVTNEDGEEVEMSPTTAWKELHCLRCEDLQGAVEEAEERAAALEQEVRDLSSLATKLNESRQLSETLNRQLANLDSVLNELEEEKVELADECRQLKEENKKLIDVNTQLQAVNAHLMDKLDKKLKK